MSAYAPRVGPRVYSALRKWAYNMSGFNQYGLHLNDCYHETSAVQEAIKRLPQHVQDERAFRIRRAINLCACKRLLPKDQWTKWEEDVKYLDPYLEEVEREWAEKDEWHSKN